MGARRRDDPPLEDWEEIYTVTEMTEAIRQSLESEFPSVNVLGEIANFKAHTSGHLYFSLRDQSNLISAVVFRRDVESLGFGPDNGMLVIASGRISHYGGSGRTQLVAYRLTPAGRGALELEFRALLQKLMGEGLTAPERKRAIAPYPSRIVVITSETGAVIRDITDTLRRRWPVAEVVHIPSAVQGSGAASSIVRALDAANRLDGVDAVILARGGGSVEDLQAFNCEEVARSVAASRYPVITGIGHEIDTTVADYVSDLRAATPTAAAELATPLADDVLDGVFESQRRLEAAFRGLHEKRLHLLEYLLRSSSFSALVHRCEQAELKLDDAIGRLDGWWRLRRRECASGIEESIRAIQMRVQSDVVERERRLPRLRARIAAVNARGRIAAARSDVAGLLAELSLRTSQSMELSARDVEGTIRALEGMHPRTVLRRGYTYCTRADGDSIIGRVGGVTIGDDVTVHFYDGRAVCSVTGKRKGQSWRKR